MKPVRSVAVQLLCASALACGGSSGRSDEASPAPTDAVPKTDAPIVRAVAPPPSLEPGFAKVLEYTALFYRGDLSALHAHFSDEMKKTLPLDKLVALRASVDKQYGKEVKVLAKDTKAQGKYRAFVRWARFDKYDGVIEVLFMLRDDDTIAGFFIRPAQPPPSPAPR